MNRTSMKCYNVRVDPSNPAGSLQKEIDKIESKGHYVMQYIPLGGYDGMIMAHDYPDKKDKTEPKVETPAAPSPIEQAEGELNESEESSDAPSTTENTPTNPATRETPAAAPTPSPGPAKAKGKK